YLRSVGVPIPNDTAGKVGTLAILFSNALSEDDVSATVRTTTLVSNGRAGLSYPAVKDGATLTGRAFVCALQQVAGKDRSNLAIENAGIAEGPVTLRVTVFSGDPSHPFSTVVEEKTLAPGEFKQYNQILRYNDALRAQNLTNGYAMVERIAGTGEFFTYGID